MKLKILVVALLAMVSLADAQKPLPATDPNLIDLLTPTLLKSTHSLAGLDLRYFGGYDKTLHGSVLLGYGLRDDVELDLAGSFSKWNNLALSDGGDIRFGGTDEEFSVKYRLPIGYPVMVEVGEAYVQTPAQPHRLATTLGGSIGYSPESKVRLYVNPRAVLLQSNSLVGIGIGAAVDIAPKFTLIGDWTPLVAGDNTIDTQTTNRSRHQLYSIGLRLTDICPNGTLDIGVTNSSGITTGSSLTPSLGDSPALYAGFTYRF